MHFQKPREIAARVLLQREAKRGFIEDLLEEALAQAQLSPSDRGLAQEIAYGAARWERTLDWLIGRKTGGKTQKPALRVLLRSALYQLFWLSRIPDHAAVHETVELARQMGCGPQSGFVNAVLRGYLREREATESELARLKSEDPGLGYSHPAWLCDRWQQRLGRDVLIQLLEWNNTPPKAFARVNLLKTDPTALREQWEKEKIEAKLASISWAKDVLVYELSGLPSVSTLPSFQRGWFYIQDPSTLLSVMELDPQPGEAVLDLCAAPGGKTAFIAERMQNRGSVVAHDVSESRVQLIRENCERLGATVVKAVVPSMLANETVPFDRILVDAPCSNTGVMRRRVDLRWRMRTEEIHRLRGMQLQLLDDAGKRLKPGGALVYSTCSLEPEENESLVQEFLKIHPEYHFQREHALTPFTEAVDGAYVARMIKGA